jgi:phospholipid/cholesterol/gamma-HCH transport system substrate-binding protein
MSTPFRERNPVVIGAISLAVLAGLLLASFKAASLPIIGGGDVYYAAFSEAGGLEPDDEVRIAGVRVGKVEEIESAAAIKVKTLLGSMFLAIEPAGEGQMNEGYEIPVERTTSPFDVVEAFSGLAETSAEIDTDQLAESLTTFADLTRNTPKEFRAALDGVSALSSNIAAKNEQIGTLLQNLEKVSNVLDERDEDIIALMEDADVLFRALVQRREAIHRLLVSTSKLSVELTALVRQSREDLAPALANLESVVQVLNKNEDNIDNSLRLMAPFYRVFANTLGTGPWFDTYIQNLPPVGAPNLGVGG